MNLQELMDRSGNACEICTGNEQLQEYEPSHKPEQIQSGNIYICESCISQIDRRTDLETEHWKTHLENAMWSEVPAVQVVAWRMLNRFRDETWAAEKIEMMYLDDEHMAWAKASGDHESDGMVDLHRDCNGAQLFTGDTVILNKRLDVKGSTVNLALGTVVKNIRLDPNDMNYVEGKVEGQSIMIKTEFIRKQGADQMS